jgi:hypothetical protein
MSSAQHVQPATPQAEDDAEGMSKRTLVALWLSIGVFAVGCVLFLFWYSHSTNQAKIAAANDRIAQAVNKANQWITAGNQSPDSDAVEQELAAALKDEVATDKHNGDAVLIDVRKRREQLAKEARIAQAQRQATAKFNDAKRNIDGKDVPGAIALLREYVANPNATEKAVGQRLLAEAELAVSDTFTFDTLVAMDKTAFSRAKTEGSITDGKITNPVLLTVRTDTIRRNLDKAAQRREEIEIAEKQRLEAERLATMQRQKEQEEQRKLEAARKTEEERLRAERERPQDGSDLFAQMTTFPEQYIGMNYYVKGLLYPGFNAVRDKEFKCFSIKFINRSVASGGPFADRFSLITSEEMGAALVGMRSGSYTATIHINFRYLHPDKKKYPVGYISKIEFWQFDLEVLKEYVAIKLYEDGKLETHPKPFQK